MAKGKLRTAQQIMAEAAQQAATVGAKSAFRDFISNPTNASLEVLTNALTALVTPVVAD